MESTNTIEDIVELESLELVSQPRATSSAWKYFEFNQAPCTVHLQMTPLFTNCASVPAKGRNTASASQSSILSLYLVYCCCQLFVLQHHTCLSDFIQVVLQGLVEQSSVLYINDSNVQSCNTDWYTVFMLHSW